MAKPSKRWNPPTDEVMRKIFPKWRARDAVVMVPAKHGMSSYFGVSLPWKFGEDVKDALDGKVVPKTQQISAD